MEDNTTLASEIVKFIKLLRIIYKGLNNDIYESLGKPFQKSVSGIVNMIPSDWSRGALDCYLMMKDMATCIDFQKLSKNLHKRCARVWGKIDSKEFVFECMRGYCTESIGYEKAAENILSNLDPLFKAVDFIFGHELVFMDRLASIASAVSQNDDPLAA